MNRKPGRPKDEETKKTRDKYLDSAKHLFVKNGYIKTSLAEIGKHAGFEKNNIYHYWKSKEELFHEITGCISSLSITEACENRLEFAMVVEKMLSEKGVLINKLSELSPELLVAML